MPPDFRAKAKYRELVREFKPNTGRLLACLHKVQHHYGYIPTDAVGVIADQFEMTAATVWGTITYYTELRTSPPAELTVEWCSGPACRLKGGDDIRRVLETVLDTAMEETTPDGRTGLHVQQCDGSCEYAPLVWLKRHPAEAEGMDALLTDERGEVRGRLTIPDAVEMARRLKSGDVNV